MIKKWDNFVKESIDYKSIQDNVNYILNATDYEGGDVGKKRHLISIFENELELEDSDLIYKNHTIRALSLYTEYIYNDKSKEIRKYLQDIKYVEPLSIESYSNKILTGKSINEIAEMILNVIDLYKSIEDEIDDRGIPKRTKLSVELEEMALASLDDDILELFDVVESYSNIYLELGYDNDNLNAKLLEKISDDINSLCSRIEDSTILENDFIEFSDSLLVGFKFKNKS